MQVDLVLSHSAMSMALVTKRILASIAVLPHTDDFKYLAAGALFCWVFQFVGTKAGIYKWQPYTAPRAVGWSVMYMFVRATLEETIFRAIMCPHPKVDGAAAMVPAKFAMSAALPVLLFVVSHALTTQRQGGTVLSDFKFLSTVTLVGGLCTWIYWMTSGALWAAVAMHYVTVLPWMVLLGGHRKTHTPTPLKGSPVGTKRE